MLFAKVVTVIIAGVFTVLTARRLMNELNAAKVRVKPRQPNWSRRSSNSIRFRPRPMLSS